MTKRGTTKESRLSKVLRKYSEHVEFALKDCPWPVDQSGDITDDTVLHVAVRRGAIDDVGVLVLCGADINRHGDMGFTAMHYAVQGANPEMIALLLEHGADPRLRNEWNQDAHDLLELVRGQITPGVFDRILCLLVS